MIKKIIIGVVILWALFMLNECSNPNWFNGGGCGGVISADTWLGDLLNIDCD